MKANSKLLATITLAPLLVLPLAAQESEDGETSTLREEIEGLKSGQQAIQRELQEIKRLLTQRQPTRQAPTLPPNVTLDVTGEPGKGVPDARLAMIEFLDYQWPYCARYVRETYPKIEEQYVSTGKVRYFVMDLPLRSHPHAFKAAEAAACAGDQGQFWEMHDVLFANQRALEEEKLGGYAEGLGLDRAAFDECLSSGKYTQEVQTDLTQAGRAGVSATPTFLFGELQDDGSKIKVTQQLRGAQPLAAFQGMLDRLLVPPEEEEED